MYGLRETLDCQTCGDVLRWLTDAEAQLVSENPYNFIIDCRDCAKDWKPWP